LHARLGDHDYDIEVDTPYTSGDSPHTALISTWKSEEGDNDNSSSDGEWRDDRTPHTRCAQLPLLTLLIPLIPSLVLLVCSTCRLHSACIEKCMHVSNAVRTPVLQYSAALSERMCDSTPDIASATATAAITATLVVLQLPLLLWQ
jgi:hypothetical protein